MPILPAEILADRYRIVQLLGRGSRGAVYRAWDQRDQKEVAIKEYLDASDATQRLFRAEARRLHKLSHPALPTVLDHFIVDGVGQYLVSDYVAGVDLQSLIDQYGALPADRAIAWLQAVCEPLAYLHNQGSLHLNIKPANIRLTPDGEVMLVDGGLPGLGIDVGNSGYASPEQQVAQTATAESDIYSLGATLYTLLTGRKPVDAAKRKSGLQLLKSARDVNGDVAPYLSIVAARALSLRPDARYDTAAQFAEALARPSSSPKPIPQPSIRRVDERPRSVAPAPRLPQSKRRQMELRTIWALLGVLLVVLSIGGAITFLNRDTTEADKIEATATVFSQIAAALTEIAPTATATPPPPATPSPTPPPYRAEKTDAAMLFMPGGPIRIGNDDADKDEAPSHIVKLDPFYIDQTEVTNSAYADCVADDACAAPQSPRATYHPAYYGDPAYDNYPVIFVTWPQAATFCEWRDGRLPTEAEWEYAAGLNFELAQKQKYPWGDEFDGERLNYCDTNCSNEKRDINFDDDHKDTAPVDSYPAGKSPLGTYNMSGNVMEWVSDWYATDYYAASHEVNPFGPAEGDTKVIRGGSWLASAEESTVTARTRFEPAVARANLGFRCAMYPK